jgi:hypothetical protein
VGTPRTNALATNGPYPPRGGLDHRVEAEALEARWSGWIAGRDPSGSLVQVLRVSPLWAGIIGAGRSWTVWMISVLSIPRRYTDVIARSA